MKELLLHTTKKGTSRLHCLFLLLGSLTVSVQGGLQLDKQPEEHMYTDSAISAHNRNQTEPSCLCVVEENTVVRVATLDVVASGAIAESKYCASICKQQQSCSGGAANSVCHDGRVGQVVRIRLGNLWPLFVWDHKGPRNSNHLTDPFTITHVSHGIFFFVVWALLGVAIGKKGGLVTSSWWTMGGILIGFFEATWELWENLPYMIIKFRAGGMSRDYYGDAAVNIVGDWAAALIGYYVCVRCCQRGKIHRVIWGSCLVFVISELALVLYQRDCMTLILLQLSLNPMWLIEYQQQESFADRLLASRLQ